MLPRGTYAWQRCVEVGIMAMSMNGSRQLGTSIRTLGSPRTLTFEERSKVFYWSDLCSTPYLASSTSRVNGAQWSCQLKKWLDKTHGGIGLYTHHQLVKFCEMFENVGVNIRLPR